MEAAQIMVLTRIVFKSFTSKRLVVRVPTYRPSSSMPCSVHAVGSQKDIFMNVIIWLVVGGLIGWAASSFMRTQEGMFLNVVVGIVGAALGGWFLSPFVGVSTINQSNFSVPSLLVSFLGAVILLAVVNLVRRGVPR
jgi:uncharacterized membrane protein YeaQ/YmgE (transglycosylase-associated protein family)